MQKWETWNILNKKGGKKRHRVSPSKRTTAIARVIFVLFSFCLVILFVFLYSTGVYIDTHFERCSQLWENRIRSCWPASSRGAAPLPFGISFCFHFLFFFVFRLVFVLIVCMCVCVCYFLSSSVFYCFSTNNSFVVVVVVSYQLLGF